MTKHFGLFNQLFWLNYVEINYDDDLMECDKMLF